MPRTASVGISSRSAIDDNTTMVLGRDDLSRRRFAHHVENALDAQHQRDQRQGLQRLDAESEAELAERRHGAA